MTITVPITHLMHLTVRLEPHMPRIINIGLNAKVYTHIIAKGNIMMGPRFPLSSIFMTAQRLIPLSSLTDRMAY